MCLTAADSVPIVAWARPLTREPREIMQNVPDWVIQAGLLAILAVVAWSADWIAARVITGVVRRLAARTKSTWDDRVIEHRVFSRISHTSRRSGEPAPRLRVLFGQ